MENLCSKSGCSCIFRWHKSINHYDVLGVRPNASKESVKAAYLQKCKEVRSSHCSCILKELVQLKENGFSIIQMWTRTIRRNTRKSSKSTLRSTFWAMNKSERSTTEKWASPRTTSSDHKIPFHPRITDERRSFTANRGAFRGDEPLLEILLEKSGETTTKVTKSCTKSITKRWGGFIKTNDGSNRDELSFTFLMFQSVFRRDEEEFQRRREELDEILRQKHRARRQTFEEEYNKAREVHMRKLLRGAVAVVILILALEAALQME